jgi:shikimate kinase
LYRQVADLAVETDGRTTREVADAILDAWIPPGEQSR